MFLGTIGRVQGTTKEIIVEIPGPWSAELETAQSLGIDLPKEVQVGDPVGRL